MSHEAHHDTHHQPAEATPTTSFRSSVWFVIILAGLFIAAVNFVNVMGHDEGEGHGSEAHHTESVSGHHPSSHEAGAAAEAATTGSDTQNAEEAHPAEEAPAEHH